VAERVVLKKHLPKSFILDFEVDAWVLVLSNVSLVFSLQSLLEISK